MVIRYSRQHCRLSEVTSSFLGHLVKSPACQKCLCSQCVGRWRWAGRWCRRDRGAPSSSGRCLTSSGTSWGLLWSSCSWTSGGGGCGCGFLRQGAASYGTSQRSLCHCSGCWELVKIGRGFLLSLCCCCWGNSHASGRVSSGGGCCALCACLFPAESRPALSLRDALTKLWFASWAPH